VRNHEKAATAKAKLIEYATRKGWQIYFPFTDGGKVDAILEIDGRLWRAQIKYSAQQRYEHTLIIKTSSTQPRRNRNRKTKYDIEDFDLLITYSAITDKLYVFAVDDIVGKNYVTLRLGPTRNGQVKGVHQATEFEYNFNRAMEIVQART